MTEDGLFTPDELAKMEPWTPMQARGYFDELNVLLVTNQLFREAWEAGEFDLSRFDNYILCNEVDGAEWTIH